MEQMKLTLHLQGVESGGSTTTTLLAMTVRTNTSALKEN